MTAWHAQGRLAARVLVSRRAYCGAACLPRACYLGRPCRSKLMHQCRCKCRDSRPPYGRVRRTVSTTSAKCWDRRSRSSTARSLSSTSPDGNARNLLAGADVGLWLYEPSRNPGCALPAAQTHRSHVRTGTNANACPMGGPVRRLMLLKLKDGNSQVANFIERRRIDKYQVGVHRCDSARKFRNVNE